MSTRITVEQLEHMKTHELAELLANVVLVLRRMPNVECRELMQQAAPKDSFVPAEEVPIPAKGIKKEEIISKILERSANRHSEQYAIQNV